MHCILVYDVHQKRVAKLHRYMQQKLYWMQNSTFAGELSDHQKKLLFQDTARFLDQENDSLILFLTRDPLAWRRTVLGYDKSALDGVLL